LALRRKAGKEMRARRMAEAFREALVVEQPPDRRGERGVVARWTGEAVLSRPEDLAQRRSVAGDERTARGGGLIHLVGHDHAGLAAGAEHAQDDGGRSELGRECRERDVVSPADGRPGAT